MNTHLLFDFSVNKENNTIHVKREFAAPLHLVWDAWTKAELLDLWWAPKPFRAQTKTLNFSEGGYWLYAMVSPENQSHWARSDYQKIADQQNFSTLNSFCDEAGTINPDFASSSWNNSFSEAGETTTVDVLIQYQQLSDLEKMVAMGFKEGFTMGLNNLEAYLASQIS